MHSLRGRRQDAFLMENAKKYQPYQALGSAQASCPSWLYGEARSPSERRRKNRLKDSRRVKPLLYVYRVLLTGIHLMRTGEVEANLPILNEEFRLPFSIR